MASNFAFSPFGATTPITATVATATVTITGGVALSAGRFSPSGVRIANIGTVAVFVQFGVTAPTVAAATGMPLLANTVETFSFKGQSAMAFTSAGTSTMYITAGEGL